MEYQCFNNSYCYALDIMMNDSSGGIRQALSTTCHNILTQERIFVYLAYLLKLWWSLLLIRGNDSVPSIGHVLCKKLQTERTCDMTLSEWILSLCGIEQYRSICHNRHCCRQRHRWQKHTQSSWLKTHATSLVAYISRKSNASCMPHHSTLSNKDWPSLPIKASPISMSLETTKCLSCQKP